MSNQIPPASHALAPAPPVPAPDTPAPASSSADASSGKDLISKAETKPAIKGPSPLQLNWRNGQKPKDIEKLTHNPESDLNLHRLKRYPPVVEMTPREMVAALQELREDVSENWKTVKTRPGFSQLFSTHGLKDAIRTFDMKKKWNQRLEQTIKILNAFTREDMSRCACLAYMVDGRLVGGLLLRPGSPPYVADVLTHPGSEKAMGVLMEEAANLSRVWKAEGKLALIADNKQAYSAYTHMGFVRTTANRFSPRNYMTLDPVTSEKWHQDLEGKLRLKKFGDDELDRYNEKEFLG